MRVRSTAVWLGWAGLVAACSDHLAASQANPDAAEAADSTSASSGSGRSEGTFGDAATADASDATRPPFDSASEREAASSGGAFDDAASADASVDGSDATTTPLDGGAGEREAASDAHGTDSASDSAADAGPCGSCGVRDDTQVCVEHFVVGGGFRPPDDAGRCPVGQAVVPESNGTCIQPPRFTCGSLPSACFPTGGARPSNCVCAPSLCAAGEILCTDVSPALMRCVLPAP